MNYGLTLSEIKSLTDLFTNTPKIEKAVLFGSRAKGNYRPGSDIDIAVYGQNLSFDDILTLQVQLEELDLLQQVDLVHFERVQDSDVKDHITRVGIILYERADKRAV